MLWSRAHDQCAFTGCQQSLTTDAQDAATGQIRANPVGEQAHIRSPKPDGPRYDPKYPKDDLDTYENLVLLCPTHHARIDADGGAEFTVATLLDMRKMHETQAHRRKEIDTTIKKYTAQQYGVDDKVLFEQVDLNGPSVDSMFVDVPFSCRPDAGIAGLMYRISETSPGDSDAYDNIDDQVVTGAAQALLHPDWEGNALLVGGPGQGKSTLLQYVCQFHRAMLLERDTYQGQEQHLTTLTTQQRVPIRLDLRKYAAWAASGSPRGGRSGKGQGKKKTKNANGQDPVSQWRTIEEYIVTEIVSHSGGRNFSIEDLGVLVSTRPVLVALDGLDEVANLKYREQVSSQIVNTQLRLEVDAANLMMLVATRPGGTTSELWSSNKFPWLSLRRLTQGLRIQYLQRWAKVANLKTEAAEKLQRTFVDNQNVPHIRELASYPMQLAILLHLLHRRQLLPQRRTELYSEYLKTFLDREQSGEKEPLLAEERQVIEDIHAYIGWHIHTQAEEGRSSGSIKRDTLMQLIFQHLEGREDGRKLAEKLFTAFTTRVLCLVERDTDLFQFEVQSLREYFAALYIFDESEPSQSDECLIALLKRPYWSNVCRFLVGQYTKGEVRGMRPLLQDLSKERELGLHPLLRSTAALFLNDRTYEGQKESPIQEIVDFILTGSGVVLAEDGLLDAGGSGLKLSDRAGRIQAVQHLKTRLVTESDSEVRVAVTSSLRRHVVDADSLSSWWWDQSESADAWLDTASKLRVLNGLTPANETRLLHLLNSYKSNSIWATQHLTAGGYDGIQEDILTIVKEEINDGAAEAIQRPSSLSSVGRILIGANIAMFRPTGNVDPRSADTKHTRMSGGVAVSLLSQVVKATHDLRSQASDTDSDWQQRLMLIEEVWGDGWVLRQALATIPPTISLETIALLVQSKNPDLYAPLTAEFNARTHRKDVDWWRQQLNDVVDDFMLRHWIFSILTCAFSPVITALADDLNRVVEDLTPKHYLTIRNAINSFHQNPSVSRKLALNETLRLNQANFSARTLWLIREGVTESTVEQIDKRIAADFGEFLAIGSGDLREIARLSGKTRTIKFDVFRGHRAQLPAGGWASTIKLGALSPKLAADILRSPHEWPGDLVQRAVEKVELRMLSTLTPLSQVAAEKCWFND